MTSTPSRTRAQPSTRRPRGLPRRVAFTALALLLVLLAIEGLLRLATAASPLAFHHWEYRTAAWLLDDNPHWGVWHAPDAESRHVRPCGEATYRSNSWGMRDVARSKEPDRRPRIAMLGDSFVEGAFVDDDATLPRLLEREALGGVAEVLNFGTSGCFGTTQEWLLYEHLARDFQPDLVVVAFFNENDLFDVSWRYWSERPPRRRPYLVPGEGGRFELFYPEVEPVARPLGARVENHLMRYSHLARLVQEVGLRLKYAGRPPKALEVYADPPGPLVAEAWRVVAEALRRLQAATARDGAELVVVQLVDPAQIDPAQAARIASYEGHDALAPNRRLRAIAAELDLRYLSLHDAFVSRRDALGLEPPYFSAACDGHYQRSGNLLAAETIAAFLRDQGLVP